MGSLLGKIADDMAEEHEAKYGDRDRLASKQLEELRDMPSELFTVNEIGFLLHPFGKFYCEWDDNNTQRVAEIYKRVKGS